MRGCCSSLILILSVAGLSSCNRATFYSAVASDCNRRPTIAHQWPSADGNRKIVESRFDCPGWYALKLEVTNPDGSKAVALDDRPSDQVRATHWPELQVEWKSASEVWITYPARQDTTCISNAAGVTVHCLDAAVRR